MGDEIMDLPVITGGDAVAGAGDQDLEVPKVNLERFSAQIKAIRESVAAVAEQNVAGLSLDQVVLELGITAEGSIGFIVSGSVQASASLTLTFK